MATNITNAQRAVLQTRNHRGKLMVPKEKEKYLSVSQIEALNACIRYRWITWLDSVAAHPSAMELGIHGPMNVYLLTRRGEDVCDEHKIPHTD